MDSFGSWKTREFASGIEHNPQGMQAAGRGGVSHRREGEQPTPQTASADSERRERREVAREGDVAHIPYNCEAQSPEIE